MCPGDLFEARSPPVPRAHWATPTLVLQEHSSAVGPCARNRRTRAPAFGLPGWAGTAGERSRNSAPAFLRPEGSRSGGGGDRGARVRLTCGRAGPGLLSSERGPAGGKALTYFPTLPARRPPRSFHRAVAANQPPGAGARAHRGLSNSRPALLLALLLPTGAGPGPGARRLSPTPPQLPDALAERAVTAGSEGGRGAARLLGPGARVAPEPLAPRADSVQRAAPGSAGSARCAGGRGCWRASPACTRAAAAEGPGCAPSRAAATAGARGRNPAAPRTPAP